MKIIKEEIKINSFNSKVFEEYFKDLRLITFDIETMGLNAKYSELILACFMEVKNDTGYITQFFLDSIEEEPILCYEIIKKLNEYDVCLTYNGTTFDIPFIKERTKILSLKSLGYENLDIKTFNFDLFSTIKRNSSLKDKLPNLKQKTIEKYLRIDNSRDDEISGAESIELFKKYIFETNETIKNEFSKKILLHNHDDVIQLYKILPIIKQVDFHKSRFKMGFPIKGINGWNDLHIDKIDIKNQNLKIIGHHFERDFSYMGFDINVSFNNDGTFFIDLPIEKYQNALFINLLILGLNTSNLSLLSGFQNGYLVLKEEEIKYKECNELVKEILISIMKKIPR